MFKAGEQHALCPGTRVQVLLDLHDAGNRIPRLAEELQAHGARVLRRAMQNPARRADQSVAALLLNARQSPEELVGYVLAEAGLAKFGAVNVQPLAAQYPGF